MSNLCPFTLHKGQSKVRASFAVDSTTGGSGDKGDWHVIAPDTRPVISFPALPRSLSVRQAPFPKRFLTINSL